MKNYKAVIAYPNGDSGPSKLWEPARMFEGATFTTGWGTWKKIMEPCLIIEVGTSNAVKDFIQPAIKLARLWKQESLYIVWPSGKSEVTYADKGLKISQILEEL